MAFSTLKFQGGAPPHYYPACASDLGDPIIIICSSSWGMAAFAPSTDAPSTSNDVSGEDCQALKSLTSLRREACTYTSCYCEENVYQLCSQLSGALPSSWGVYAVFISNAAKCTPVWLQKHHKDTQTPALWDYHVVAVVLPAAGEGGSGWVLDLDSVLPFPCPGPAYVLQAFRPHEDILPEYRQCFRVVPWCVYVDCFASDRSHMRRPDGTWNAPPPRYPPIVGAKAASAMTLPQLWDTTQEGEGMGRLLSLQGFQHFLGTSTATA